MKKGIDFPAVANAGVALDVAKELADGLKVLFSDTASSSALSILLTGTLNMAAKMLPREVLDGIFEYETSQVYGPREPPRDRQRSATRPVFFRRRKS
ncbi:MAG: hypothetical protein EPN91_08670 [Salinibacterium sp.]|nr:MAG: hypothetical protein EPN91_08670 [Salinibacterium sp.]